MPPLQILSPAQFRTTMSKYHKDSAAGQVQIQNLIAEKLGIDPTEAETLLDHWSNSEDGYQRYLALGQSEEVIDRYLGYVDLRGYGELRHHGIERPTKFISITKDGTEEVHEELFLYLDQEPALPRWDWPQGPWRPKHCIQMRERMAHFYTTAFGHLALRRDCENLGRIWGYPEDLVNTTEAIRERALERHLAWAGPDLLVIHADENFVTMADAAALSAPIDNLKPDELLSDQGVIFFRNQMQLQAVSSHLKIRAIRWRLLGPGQAGGGDHILLVDLLQDGTTAYLTEEQINSQRPGLYELERYLILRVPRAIPISDLAGNSPDTNGTVAFLRAMGQIAKSPKTRSEDVGVGRGDQSGKKKSRRQRMSEHQDTVRILSLREPSHARLEHNAATGADSRIGMGVKQHYVRGHWRNQWYSSVKGHRAIWIDGFVKGDPTLGTVSSPAVHLARSPE